MEAEVVEVSVGAEVEVADAAVSPEGVVEAAAVVVLVAAEVTSVEAAARSAEAVVVSAEEAAAAAASEEAASEVEVGVVSKGNKLIDNVRLNRSAADDGGDKNSLGATGAFEAER